MVTPARVAAPFPGSAGRVESNKRASPSTNVGIPVKTTVGVRSGGTEARERSDDRRFLDNMSEARRGANAGAAARSTVSSTSLIELILALESPRLIIG